MRRGDRERMPRIRVAVEELDRRASGPVHERVVDALRAITPPIGTVPLLTAFAKVIRSGVTPNACAPNGVAQAAEAGDHLVEDQQDAVLVADLAQALAGSRAAARSRPPSPASARRSPRRWSMRRAARPVRSSSSARCAPQVGWPLRERHFREVRAYAAGGRRRASSAARTSCGWRPCRRPRCRPCRRRGSPSRGR